MIGLDYRVRVKIVLSGINSKMADVALTSLLLAAPHIFQSREISHSHYLSQKRENFLNNPLEEVQSIWPPKPAADWASSVMQSSSLAHLNSDPPTGLSSEA